MLVRCPRCSTPRDAEREKASGSVPACANCGYTGAPFGPSDDPGPRQPLSTFAGARAKLATATQDLFRLSGNSIPVEAEAASAPPPAPEPVKDPTEGRKAEASIMFSLEALMKANTTQAQPQASRDEAPEQLWSMQGATPLFGTEYDQALLTTPLKTEQSSMDSMTVPSRRPPTVRRLMPLLIAIAAGSTALAGVAWWAFGPTESEAKPSAEVAAVEPSTPIAEPEAEAAPAPGVEPAAPTNTDPPPTQDVAAPEEAEKPAEPSQEAQAAAPEGSSDSADTEPEAPAKGKKKSASSKRTASAKPAAPTSAKAPFNTSAARDALNAASSRAAGCKGTSGTGKIQVTFATSGRVSNAQIVSGPFGGTAAGKCALRHFKAAKVPPFTGSPTTVAKSFKIP